MVIKYIQSVIRGGGLEEARHLGGDEGGVGQKAKLIDVAHEVLTRQAAEDRATLEALVRMGWPHVERERFKKRVRRKVWDVVGEDVGTMMPDMVEEVTERITDVAEADEYYKKMFEWGET